MTLALVHARAAFDELRRTPAAVVPMMVFPALFFAMFVVPAVSGDPVAATFSVGSILVFAVAGVALFQFGVGVAEERAKPWEAYVRTLPVTGLTRFVGRLLVTVGVLGAGGRRRPWWSPCSSPRSRCRSCGCRWWRSR